MVLHSMPACRLPAALALRVVQRRLLCAAFLGREGGGRQIVMGFMLRRGHHEGAAQVEVECHRCIVLVIWRHVAARERHNCVFTRIQITVKMYLIASILS